MLEIRDLVCGYGHVSALKGLTIDVREGQLVALVGANGAGKSTTLRAISGLVKARSGAIRFKGKDITTAEPRHILREGIAHCPEGRRVFPQMSVAENLGPGRRRGGPGAHLRRVPPVGRTEGPGRRHAFGGRAADARHRPGADGPPRPRPVR